MTTPESLPKYSPLIAMANSARSPLSSYNSSPSLQRSSQSVAPDSSGIETINALARSLGLPNLPQSELITQFLRRLAPEVLAWIQRRLDNLLMPSRERDHETMKIDQEGVEGKDYYVTGKFLSSSSKARLLQTAWSKLLVVFFLRRNVDLYDCWCQCMAAVSKLNTHAGGNGTASSAATAPSHLPMISYRWLYRLRRLWTECDLLKNENFVELVMSIILLDSGKSRLCEKNSTSFNYNAHSITS
ncbi:hypothetical protein Ciccas_007106 [Cichlidogyrus casuarinus]|uniref:Uncharacterized protein n=1 Tax=Cichlidogyrus casuarinus TaxID=1844966 RepID=A0ABD2Q3T5_9PLAT